jgi:hypothetical protein
VKCSQRVDTDYPADILVIHARQENSVTISQSATIQSRTPVETSTIPATLQHCINTLPTLLLTRSLHRLLVNKAPLQVSRQPPLHKRTEQISQPHNILCPFPLPLIYYIRRSCYNDIMGSLPMNDKSSSMKGVFRTPTISSSFRICSSTEMETVFSGGMVAWGG